MRTPKVGKLTFVLAVFGIVVFLCFGLTSLFANRTELKLAFRGLSVEESITITKELQRSNIPFELQRHGRDVWVPTRYLLEVRETFVSFKPGSSKL